MFPIWRRLRARLRYRHFDEDVAREIETHRAMIQDDLHSQGASRDSARTEAARSLGNVMLAREAARSVWIAPFLDSIVQDVAYGIRSLQKHPGYTLAVTATLTVGIGLNVGMFTIFNAMALRPWTPHDPARVVLAAQRPAADGRSEGFTLADLEYIRPRATAFEALSGLRRSNTRIRSEGTELQYVGAGIVSSSFFDVLRTPMALGRGFAADDERPGATPVVVISYSSWQRHFSGAPDVIGKPLHVYDTPTHEAGIFTIIGVAPDGFHAPPPQSHEAWFLLNALGTVRPNDSAFSTGAATVSLIGRLGPKTPRAAAASELTVLHRQARMAANRASNGIQLTSTAPISYSSSDQFVGAALMQASLVVVLLLACVNVASMQLARSLARRHEIAIRLSLGASRMRIVRQLLTEASLVAFIATAGAVVLAYTVPPYLYERFMGSDLISQPWTPDRIVVIAAGVLGVLSVLGFALTPALQSTHVTLPHRAIGGEHGDARRPARLRTLLLSGQIALTTVLLAGASLLSRSLMHVAASDVGFQLNGTAAAHFTSATMTPAELRQAIRTVQSTLRGSRFWPVGVVDYEPLEPNSLVATVRYASEPPDAARSVSLFPMSSDTVRVLHLSLAAGRLYSDDPAAGEAMVNETMARRYWPTGNVLGQTLLDRQRRYTVVGVLRDARLKSFYPVEPMLFRPAFLVGLPSLLFNGAPEDVASDLRAVAGAVDPRLTVEVLPVSANIESSLQSEIFASRIAWGVGTLGLSLAMLGVFGLFVFVVQARRREIGIRMALGARPSQVIAAILATTRNALVAGLGVGLLLSVGAAVLLRGQLFGLSPVDPIAYATALAVLGVAAVIATLVPVLTAVKIDPAVTLRAE